MSLVRIIDELLVENDIKNQKFAENKGIEFEYYSTRDEKGGAFINSVRITYEDGQSREYKISTLKSGKRGPIVDMALKGVEIVKYLGLIKDDLSPADIVVLNGKIKSISGYTLENEYSINQVDKAFMDAIKVKKDFKSESK